MKKTKTYRFDEIILKACRHLINKDQEIYYSGIDTATGIAKTIDINPKTAQKYLTMAVNLGILLSDKLYESTDHRKCMAYKINPKYMEIMTDID